MSDQSLREALEKLRKDLAECYPGRAPYDIPSTTIDRIDALLAAHPVEPVAPSAELSRMSVEAHQRKQHGDWDQAGYEAAVAAGMPRLPGDDINHPNPVQVEITDEAVEAVMRDLALWDDGCSLPFIEDEVDGGRAAVRHILTVAAPLLDPRPLLDREAVKRILGDVRALPVTRSTNPHVEAVMKLARPMPTREELAEAGHRWSCLKRDEPVHELDAIDYDRADEILEIWALLNGAES